MSATTKLPVLRTIIAAYAFLFRNWRDLIRIGWIPFALTVTLNLFMQLMPDTEHWHYLAAMAYGWVLWAVYTPIVAMAVVPWHRFILLGDRPRRGPAAVALTLREGRYTLWTIGIMVIAHSLNWAWMLLTGFVVWASETLGYQEGAFDSLIFSLFLVSTFIGLYLFSVLGLALPAVAVERQRGIKGALELSRRNGLQLMVLALLAFAPIYLFYTVTLNFWPESGVWSHVWTGFYDVFYLFEAFAAATILSFSYRTLGGLRGNDPGPTTIPPSGRD